MRHVGSVVGVAVARRATCEPRFPEVLVPLAATEELSTPLTGGRA